MASFTHTVLVTGGTVNLGYYAAYHIAQQHPSYKVIVASRSDPKSAATTINQRLKQNNVFYVPLDLSSLSKVRDFATSWNTAGHPPIRALVLNAGLQFPGDVEYSVDGIEKTFAVNHVGHALLYHLLEAHLTSDARIVVTSSGTHDVAQKSGMPDADYTSAEELAHPSGLSKKNPGQQRYTTSKLVNVLWAYALSRRLSSAPSPDGKHKTVTAFDPGLMPGTNLAREHPPFARFIWLHVLPHMIPLLRLLLFPNIHTADESGRALARLAVGDEVEGKTGVYFEGLREIKSAEASHEEGKQEELWAWTVKRLGVGEK